MQERPFAECYVPPPAFTPKAAKAKESHDAATATDAAKKGKKDASSKATSKVTSKVSKAGTGGGSSEQVEHAAQALTTSAPAAASGYV
jgi:hypothetical protein